MEWFYDYDSHDGWKDNDEDWSRYCRDGKGKEYKAFRVTTIGKQFTVYAKSETKAYKKACEILGITIMRLE